MNYLMAFSAPDSFPSNHIAKNLPTERMGMKCLIVKMRLIGGIHQYWMSYSSGVCKIGILLTVHGFNISWVTKARDTVVFRPWGSRYFESSHRFLASFPVSRTAHSQGGRFDFWAKVINELIGNVPWKRGNILRGTENTKGASRGFVSIDFLFCMKISSQTPTFWALHGDISCRYGTMLHQITFKRQQTTRWTDYQP